MLGFVFAQMVTVAHACTRAVPMSQAAAFALAADEFMPPDCATMAEHDTTNAKVCESHCVYGQQIDLQPDGPVAAIAPRPPLTVCASSIVPSFDKTFLHARSTAPPVSLLFSRFLI